jgi:hypothetical protein
MAAIGVVAVLVGAGELAVKWREPTRADTRAALREPLRGSRKALDALTSGRQTWRENAHPQWTAAERRLRRSSPLPVALRAVGVGERRGTQGGERIEAASIARRGG